MYHYFFVIDSVVTHLLRDKCTLNIVHCSVHYSTSGDECLTMYGVPHSSAWDLWSNEVALLILTVAFLGLTYIQLRRTSLLKWEQLPRLESFLSTSCSYPDLPRMIVIQDFTQAIVFSYSFHLQSKLRSSATDKQSINSMN